MFIRYILFFIICLSYSVTFAADGERVIEGVRADGILTKELSVSEGNFRGTNAATYDLLITAKNSGNTYIRATWTGAAGAGVMGIIHWHIWWEPLTEDGFVEAQ